MENKRIISYEIISKIEEDTQIIKMGDNLDVRELEVTTRNGASFRLDFEMGKNLKIGDKVKVTREFLPNTDNPASQEVLDG